LFERSGTHTTTPKSTITNIKVSPTDTVTHTNSTTDINITHITHNNTTTHNTTQQQQQQHTHIENTKSERSIPHYPPRSFKSTTTTTPKSTRENSYNTIDREGSTSTIMEGAWESEAPSKKGGSEADM
jgi:hypothetical protein